MGGDRLASLPPFDEGCFLFASVSRLKLVANGEDQNNVFRWQPAVLRDISVAAAGQDEFPSTFFGRLPKQRVVGQELKSLSHAHNLFARLRRVLGGDEVEESFKVCERLPSYFDRRHARALGRDVFAPDARAVR